MVTFQISVLSEWGDEPTSDMGRDSASCSKTLKRTAMICP